MTRPYARSRKGQRATAYAPQGHWHTTTLVAGLTIAGAVAPMALDGAMDRLAFNAYVSQCLLPELPPRVIVIMDNLSAHKSAQITQLIENAGATLWYLPPYSPPRDLCINTLTSAIRMVYCEHEYHPSACAA